MTVQSVVEQAAGRLRAAGETGGVCDPVRDLIGSTDLKTAYAVQALNTQYHLQNGTRLVGRKVGFSNQAIQKQFGVDQPGLGMLFADSAVDDGEEIPWNRVTQPLLEAEIAFVMGRDMDREDATTVDLLRAVDCVLPAIEVAACRIAKWDVTVADAIADNVCSGLFVLGQEAKSIGDFDMRLCGMVMGDGIEPASTGAGVNVLGSPLNSLRWVARAASRAGRPLAAGDVVLTGSLGPVLAPRPGAVIEARIEGLGSVRVAFGRAT